MSEGVEAVTMPNRPWLVVRYGLRNKSTLRSFRRRWTAELYRVVKFWPVLDMYEVERS